MSMRKMKWILVLLFVTAVKGDITDILMQFENNSMIDMVTICANYRNANVSEGCGEQLDVVCDNTTLRRTIYDASSKFPYAGMAFSTRSDYGNYDQCLSIDHSYNNGRILGEFCAIGLVIPDFLGNISDVNSYYRLSVCRPNACVASDYNAILRLVFSLSEEFQGLFLDRSCSTAETQTTFSSGDIAVMSIFGAFIFLMLISTVYDMHLYRNELKSSHPLLLAFSIFTNGKKLLHISKHATSREQVETFHGLRVISMFWIVAGHGITTWQYAAVTNAEFVETWPSLLYVFYITAAPIAVDTFFFMSGFLLAFQYFKGKTGTAAQQVRSVPHMVIHRYLRLTPALLMIYLVTITFYENLGNGPLFVASAETFSVPCKKYWWRFFLYIQNYFDFEEICLHQTWYLSADMQLFLISPLVLIPTSIVLKRYGFKNTILGLLFLNVFFTFFPMVIKLVFTEYTNEYDTHSRLIVYFVGVMLGLFMRVKIDKPFLYVTQEKDRPVINFVMWSLTIIGMLAITVCHQDQQANHGFISRTVFESLMRPAWCIGLCWITYSCYHGHGGIVNWILCRPIFQILGRLTYCLYLVHVTVILYYMGTARTKWFFSDYNGFYQFCGHYIVSIFVAMFWTLAFESPLIVIEKYFMGGSRPRKADKPSENGNIEAGPKANVEKDGNGGNL